MEILNPLNFLLHFQIILSKLYTSEGRFTFTSHSPGEHFICLYSNSTSWFSGAQLRVYLDIQTGEHTQDYEQVILNLLSVFYLFMGESSISKVKSVP